MLRKCLMMEYNIHFVPENKGVYRNQVKICRGVENCKFERTKKWKRRNYLSP